MNRFSPQAFADQIERLSSSDEEREAHAKGSASASRETSGPCADLLRELSRVLGGMLTNAQAMQWKLPAYSHSKRYVREIERGAQRGASLVQQLLRHLDAPVQGPEQMAEQMPVQMKDEFCGEAPSLAGAALAVTAQEPNAGRETLATQPRTLPAHAAPAFSRSVFSRTHIAL
jgi:hypothetical protein